MMMHFARISVTTGLVLLAGKSVTLASSAEEQQLQTRRLEDGNDDNAYFQYDLSEYSLRFERCQYVKMFDDDLAQDEDNDSPLALKHFVVYRLCPTDSCSDSCDDAAYGQYVTGVSSYLQSTIQSQATYWENFCENCDNQCNNGNGNYGSTDIDCGCLNPCDLYENLENYGYLDASQFIECQAVQQNNDDGGDGTAMYIGPRCGTSGNQITIGLFYDAYCFEPIENANVEQVLGAKLSYHLLSQSYDSTERICLSCKEDNNDYNQDNADEYNNQDANDQEDADDVNEMCEDLYNSAAKCESQTGLQNGFIQTNREENDYENQVENEFMSCTFISSLMWNSYTETGEINIGDPQDAIVRTVTQNQKMSLAFLGVVFISMLGLMQFLTQKIAKAEPLVQLTRPNAVLT
jgi:hypothetical protein